MLTLLCAMVVAAFAAVTPVAQASAAPAFSAVGIGPMTTARTAAVAAALPDGDVLIAGGMHGSADVATAELFHPATDTFSALPAPMTIPREQAVAAPLPDGRVLIAGGEDGNTILSSAELFDPATGTFAPTGPLPSPREDAAAAPLPDGRVLIVGGFDSPGVLSSAVVFDPTTGSFTTLAAHLGTPREGPAAASLPDGRVLIVGGDAGADSLSSAELFDPATSTFAPLAAQLTVVRDNPAATTLPDGRVLIAGGAAGGTLSSAELFDPATSRFTALAARLTTPRDTPLAAPLPDGRVLIASDGTAETYLPAPEASVAGGDFGDETVGQSSAAAPLVVGNLGAQALSISGAELSGSASGDFTIAHDGCAGARLAFEQTCTISVRFTPSAAGARRAALTLADNEAAAGGIALSGTGTPAISGPAGPQGPAGPTGATGARGPAGQIRLVSCTSTTRTGTVAGHRHKVVRHTCTSRLISTTVTFPTTGAVARLVHGTTVVATGRAFLGHVTLRARRPIRAGRYTLIESHRRGHRWVDTRRPITIVSPRRT